MTSKINISCFGAIRPFKNHLTQAAAAVAFAESIGKKLNFHVNYSRVEQRGDNVLKNLRGMFKYLEHDLIEHEWCDHHHFMHLIKHHIDLGMQVSFTESYNIVIADHIAMNKPVVVSSEIEFVLPIFQANPNSVNNIKETLQRAWSLRHFGTLRLNRWLLERSNVQAIDAWDSTLGYLIDPTADICKK